MDNRQQSTPKTGEGVPAWFLKNLVFPVGDRWLGQPMMRRLRFLEEAQWWPIERLLEERNRRLVALMDTIYREVPFYRGWMDAAQMRPEDIRTPADLVRVPVVDKETLRRSYPARVVRATSSRAYESCTSGSTGAAFRFRTDRETFGICRASFLLALQWAGWRFGERHMQFGMNFPRDLARRMKDRALRCHYMPANELQPAHLDAHLELLERHGVRHVWGYPGSVYCLACRAAERGWNRPLASVVTWGDNLHRHYRTAIERAFGTRVCDTYGCGEGMQVAAQCGAGVYHVHMLDVIVEFVDAHGQPVPAGEVGDVLLTRLHPGPMPFVRYRVGDIGVGGLGRPCPCGRGFQTLESIEGRDAEIVTTPAGNRLIVHFFTGIFEHVPEVAEFQVRQTAADAMTIRIVPGKGFSPETIRHLQRRFQELGAADMKTEFDLVDSIPLTPGGKRRFVVREKGGPAAGGAASL